ncbi:MAG: hypothetical protein K2N25_07565 [Muribaculaceae bacterium]|nr:hypothetical protein [Muribaculaceae bacterium]
MRYDDDRYLDDEEDKDFWDDELELSSDVGPRDVDDGPIYPRTSEPYNSYDEEDDGHRPENDVHTAGDNDNKGSVDDNDYYSDPEPPAEPRRKRLFGKKTEAEVDDDND